MPRLAFLVALLTATIARIPSRADDAAKPDRPAGKATDQEVEAIVETASKSIVVVTFQGRGGNREGLGTGFVVDPTGLIATNLHVIAEARPVTVRFPDGRRFDVAAIEASDRSQDLALLRIDARDLPALPLGDSDQIKQGQAVVAIGNPFGLTNSVVSGVVSAVRELEGRKMIQLAIPVERGNSGGPILDRQGRVIGIMSMKSLEQPNVGFAILVNSLKALVEKPNPIPMTRWLTIGALSDKEWEPLMGARWRQRAGRITVDGFGTGFGGRSLCLARKPPETPFELEVTVKLDKEEGAAGLVFCSDGADVHYGFYPTNHKLRLTRFEGPDVSSWTILEEVASPRYRPGDWNTLKVQFEKGKIRCFVNGELAIQSSDSALGAGRAGLTKFRDTGALFKQFRIGNGSTDSKAGDARNESLAKAMESLDLSRLTDAKTVAQFAEHGAGSAALLRERARLLEQQASGLQKLATRVHQENVLAEFRKVTEVEEVEIDLVHAGLLIAKLENEELDVAAYRAEFDQLVEQFKQTLPRDSDEAAKLAALDRFLFQENGFHGSRWDYYNKSNSFLNEVLDDREGLPITLSVLYMEMARRIGVKVVGVGLPGHFVVRHEPAEGKGQIIDVFDRGARLSEADAAIRVLGNTGRQLTDDDLKTTPKRQILARLVRNLLNVSGDSAGEPLRMLPYVNAILILTPDAYQERGVRALVYYRLGDIDAAVAEADWLIANRPEGVDQHRLLELREQFEKARRTQ